MTPPTCGAGYLCSGGPDCQAHGVPSQDQPPSGDLRDLGRGKDGTVPATTAQRFRMEALRAMSLVYEGRPVPPADFDREVDRYERWLRTGTR